ncbi:hypothetical protein FRZ61_35320 [Hypericibacter adhaerens]|uniref:Uncharacterized protein n=1 Tax=Hypericibacter adhaerens TaxID=2602016 RepID=A0A5J6N2Q4_9PROT|nr:hypothetical protein [Hypericibacter adhaerens]QEX23594.1 hypothetical protein FRZ61_35320 [Hypericibacter adhaerens]
MSFLARLHDRGLRPALVGGILLASLLAGAAAAAMTPTDEQKAALCGTRASCRIAKTTDAGTDEGGRALAVVELHLGLADKPAEAPEEGCSSDPDSEAKDGGVEYWLIRAGDAPTRLMALCNDGYGAAGVGEDEVTVGNNRLIHVQSGGSAWRWDASLTYSLSPFRELHERDCSYNTLTPDSGTLLDLDLHRLQARSLAWRSAAASSGDAGASTDEEGEMGCPDWPASLDEAFVAQPTADSVAAYVVPAPLGSAADPVAQGTALGNCALSLSTDGSRGFLVFGKPADSTADAAEIRVIAQGYNELLLQLYDPTAVAALEAAKGKSWVQAPHVEIWTAVQSAAADDSDAPPALDFLQFGIGLDGKVYPGAGKPADLPAVERWSATDEQDRPVQVMRLHWEDQWAFLSGVGIVYSQSLNGKQARLVATTGIVKNRPLFLPTIWTHEPEDSGQGGAHCAVENRRLMLQP